MAPPSKKKKNNKKCETENDQSSNNCDELQPPVQDDQQKETENDQSSNNCDELQPPVQDDQQKEEKKEKEIKKRVKNKIAKPICELSIGENVLKYGNFQITDEEFSVKCSENPPKGVEENYRAILKRKTEQLENDKWKICEPKESQIIAENEAKRVILNDENKAKVNEIMQEYEKRIEIAKNTYKLRKNLLKIKCDAELLSAMQTRDNDLKNLYDSINQNANDDHDYGLDLPELEEDQSLNEPKKRSSKRALKLELRATIPKCRPRPTNWTYNSSNSDAKD